MQQGYRGVFILGEFFGGVLSAGDFIFQAIFCGGFFPDT